MTNDVKTILYSILVIGKWAQGHQYAIAFSFLVKKRTRMHLRILISNVRVR